jgi:hypothetical protein
MYTGNYSRVLYDVRGVEELAALSIALMAKSQDGWLYSMAGKAILQVQRPRYSSKEKEGADVEKCRSWGKSRENVNENVAEQRAETISRSGWVMLWFGALVWGLGLGPWFGALDLDRAESST